MIDLGYFGGELVLERLLYRFLLDSQGQIFYVYILKG
jgi:hypothetical protein